MCLLMFGSCFPALLSGITVSPLLAVIQISNQFLHGVKCLEQNVFKYAAQKFVGTML